MSEQLWIWVGSEIGPTGTTRYVRATDEDILHQPCVVAALEAAHAAGRRAGLEEAAGEAERRMGMATRGMAELASTLRARADGKGRP